MWGNRRFLPHLSEADVPPAGGCLSSEVRIPTKQKAPRRVLFLFGEADFRWKSAACGREFRFAQMWQEPAVPPQTSRGLRSQTASPTAAAGRPLRSNVVGTCGSPTNAPSLTVEREGAAKRSERFSLLKKKARLRPCLLLRFQLPGRRHLRPPPRLCRRRLPPGSAQPAHPV